jgi:hypothetical protein
MKKIIKALSSRTVWSVIILFLISGVDGVQNLIPADMLTPIQFVLALLAGYFKVNPSKDY